jgi:ParB family chromosome partitioning protein
VAKKTGLGKGLGALIGETTEEAHVEDVERAAHEINISTVHRNEQQPRTQFNEEELDELADSIRHVGILQPIMVCPDKDGYMVVAGERRYQAAKRAGLTKIPVVVRAVDEAECLELALVENIQRSNLNVIEEARAYRELMKQTGMTQEALAQRLAKSRSAIANTLRLLDLPDEVQELVFDGSLTAGHARAILSAATPEMRVNLARKVVDEKLTVRQTESLAALFSVEQADKPVRAKIPPSFRRTARRLREELGTGVKIKQVQGKYKLEIDFTDEGDLERLVGRINGN